MAPVYSVESQLTDALLTPANLFVIIAVIDNSLKYKM